MYDCELFGAYNIYNITFGNCDKDNSINCHDLLPLSGNKNLKINKKTRFPIKNPTVYVYYRQQLENFPVPRWTTWRVYPVYPVIPPNLSVPIWMHGNSRKKKSDPSFFPEPIENDSRLVRLASLYWFSTQMKHF